MPAEVFSNALRRLNAPTPALPLDLFRVGLGAVAAAYFLSLCLEAGDISGPDGLIDHDLVREIFWYTRLGLFPPGLPLPGFQAIYLLAALASLPIVAGYRIKLFAAFQYLVAVSAYRWNFPVMYWDDGLMHLMLLWLLLLPVGRTLAFGRGAAHRHDWKSALVPGAAVRCFVWNILLIYFVTGLWKLTSPMWLAGTATHVALQTPAAYAPGFWRDLDFPFGLASMNYWALAFELAAPLLLCGTRFVRLWVLLPSLVGFHLFIVATLKVPFANLAMLAAACVLFRDELARRLRRPARAGSLEARPVNQALPTGQAVRRRETSARGTHSATRRHAPVGEASGSAGAPARAAAGAGNDAGIAGALALVLVCVLTFAQTRILTPAAVDAPDYRLTEAGIDPRGVGGLTILHEAAYGLLWLAGLAQRYQLFDWIDLRNYTVSYRILDAGVEMPARTMFPRTARSALLQSYLYDVVWVRLPARHRQRFRETLMRRFANRYCRGTGGDGRVEVSYTLARIVPGEPRRGESAPLMAFRCRAGEAVF